ncbi:PREDICTED: glutathione S-transferase T3-like [Camelina sativa]|uniref:Glutathione S-transferase T3-like n=1 Tax=Camelina sativa TaxID=90675 RepID=A0ABM1QLI8_CAMSA|nr:PREDICTED: glutathione S-transferase T3-like [Camelina sativa]
MDSDDSMNPYRPSPSFFNLLTSQHETQNLEYTHCESPCSEAPSKPASPLENRKSRNAWLPSDDVMLVSAWLNTSKDPIRSNEQRRGAFWERIVDYYAECPNAEGQPKREARHCKQRGGGINNLGCKFVGCFEAATREKSSGQNEDDMMKLAHEIYFNDQNQRFTLEHAWRELRYDQKWCASTSSKVNGVKKGRVVGEDVSAQPVVNVEDEPQPRPPGVKAAKAAKGKAKPVVEEDGKAFSEFQMERVTRMYEMKQADFSLKEKEFAMKKEHSLHVMLEALIAKKDSLTETEKALKEKLINDLISSG